MQINAQDLRGLALYRLMTSMVIPRPIAWVGTRSADGHDNLAPFSYFMGVGSKPPAIAISVARAGRDKLKDTARNILETSAFTVSMVPAERALQMNLTSARLDPSEDEFSAAGLVAVNGSVVQAPRPQEALATMECRLMHTFDTGSTHLLVGEVLCFHIDERVLKPGDEPTVDPVALDPLMRLGGDQYARLRDIFAMPSPK